MLGGRLGVTVRFTVAGVTNLRCLLAMRSALPARLTVRIMAVLRTVCQVDAVGRFLLTQMASVAELEAGLISERTKAALAAAKARGVKLGNPNGARAQWRTGAERQAGWQQAGGGSGEGESSLSGIQPAQQRERDALSRNNKRALYWLPN